MDAIQLLTQDHRDVEQLFSQMQSGSTGKPEAVEKLIRELSIHDAIERELLYPVVREKLLTPGERLAEHSLDEHESVARLLSDIESTDDPSEHDVLLRQLMADVKTHVHEEETQIFPQLREKLSQQELTQLGSKLESAKGRAPTHPHPHAPRSGIGAKVGGMAAAAMDKARDAVRDRS